MSCKTQEVRRVAFDPDGFVRQFQVEPIVVTGFLDRWRALSTWSPKYIAERFGHVRASVRRSPDGIFRIDADSASHAEVTISMADYVDALASPAPTERLYLQQTSIAMVFPELLEDLELHPKFDRYLMRAAPTMNLWFGAADNVSPLHFDQARNLLCQVVGRKRIALFSPDDFENLYASPPGGAVPPHLSQVNIEAPDLARFPRLAHARRIDVTIEPGEALYIPAFWWHQVYSLDLAMSVNIWWAPEPEHYLVPAMRVGPVDEQIRWNPRLHRVDVVHLFIDRGFPGLAAVLCALLVEERLRKVARERGIPTPAHDQVTPPGRRDELLVEQLVTSGVYNTFDKLRLLKWLSYADGTATKGAPVERLDVAAMAKEIETFLAR
jgi:Cupin-like domain